MNRVRPGSGWEHLLEIAKIERLDRAYTWNCAVGCNNYDCEVRRRGKCWAMIMAKRFGWNFEPHLIPEKLREPCEMQMPSVITPVSMGDIFGLSLAQFYEIWKVMDAADWHVYALLTKLPHVAEDHMPVRPQENLWFGVTVNTQEDVWRLKVLRKQYFPKKYCLFEPLYGPIDYDLSWLDLIVIGPQNYPLLQPKEDWIESVLDNAKGVRVFFKSKLKCSLNEVERK